MVREPHVARARTGARGRTRSSTRSTCACCATSAAERRRDHRAVVSSQWRGCATIRRGSLNPTVELPRGPVVSRACSCGLHPGDAGVVQRGMWARGTGQRAASACGAGCDVTLSALALLWPAAPAGAQIQGDADSQRLVTIAARECDNYADIRANLARNDIQESLRDLGADTLYTSGQPVDPRTELRGQPECRPITGWQFTFGDGIASPVTGAAGVAVDRHRSRPGPSRHAGVRARPRLGRQPGRGPADQRRGDRRADGRADRPRGPQRPLDPGRHHHGPDALLAAAVHRSLRVRSVRCAIDDLNGDNVETVAFPSGTRHAFCYAYYVTPPPSSGTIIIRKQVQGSETSETFTYTGNLSYNRVARSASRPPTPARAPPSSCAARPAPASSRGPSSRTPGKAGPLTGLTCTSQTGASTTTTNLAQRSAQITLAAADTVTCTFTNRRVRPPGCRCCARSPATAPATSRSPSVTPKGGSPPAPPWPPARRTGSARSG